MERQDILVFGGSRHAGVVIDAARAGSVYRVTGVLDPALTAGSLFEGIPVLGDEKSLPDYIANGAPARGVVAVGDNWIRMRIMRKVMEMYPDFEFVSVIHPMSIIAESAEIEPGAVVLAGAVVGPSTKVGRGTVVNSGAVLEHDCLLEDFASLGPGAVVCGNVTIGMGGIIGPGATVIQKLAIGAQTLVGAGAVVVRSLPENVLAYGNPARIVRERRPGEPYL